MCLALFESVLVSYFSNPSDQNHHPVAELIKHLMKNNNQVTPGNVKKSDAVKEEDKERSFHGNRESKVLRFHKMARVLLPAGFLIFNMVYWIYYF